jgi:hypothetical protein
MLTPMDLKMLTLWCQHRTMRWLPLRTGADTAELLLEPLTPSRPWQRMRLCVRESGFLLADETGQTLATASDLPALLDALDGGVADAQPLALLGWALQSGQFPPLCFADRAYAEFGGAARF